MFYDKFSEGTFIFKEGDNSNNNFYVIIQG